MAALIIAILVIAGGSMALASAARATAEKVADERIAPVKERLETKVDDMVQRLDRIERKIDRR